jgi:phytoene synthase
MTVNQPATSPVRQHDATATPAVLSASVRHSFAYCRKVTRQRAGNFYYGLRLTPEPKRSAVYAIYAFMRACDDLADDGDGPDRARHIEQFRETMAGVLDGQKQSDHSLWPAFRYVMRTYPIRLDYLHAMLDGQLADLTQHAYRSFDQLYDYCYHVASVVGLTCLAIWGHDGSPGALRKAELRGVALQLTNILRDLAEDAQRGRIYLPQDELDRFGYREADLRAGRANSAFDALMTFQIERARDFYDQSACLEQHIDPLCRPTCWALTRIYGRLLERIAANPRRVLRGRVRLSGWTKAGIAAQATWKRTWNR